MMFPTARSRDSAVESQPELGWYMSKTLSAVSGALQTPDGALRDDVLGAVWILANYEVSLTASHNLHLYDKSLIHPPAPCWIRWPPWTT